MAEMSKARVFMSGRSQHVTIPREYRFRSPEVSIRRDPVSGDIVLSEGPGTWSDVFAALDAAGIPDEFLQAADRDNRPSVPRPAVDALFDDEPAAKPAKRGKTR